MSGTSKEAQAAEKHVTGQSNKPMSLPPHALSCDTFAAELVVNSKDGLTSEEAKRRLDEYGLNQLDDGPGVQPLKILLRQIANAMILVSQAQIYETSTRGLTY